MVDTNTTFKTDSDFDDEKYNMGIDTARKELEELKKLHR